MQSLAVFTVVTWNVNGLRARLGHVLRFLEMHRPDVLCLQETRMDPDDLVSDGLRQYGYHFELAGTGGYAGVAIVSRVPPDECLVGIPSFEEKKAPGRRLACRFGTVWVDTVYVPTRKAIGKIGFLQALREDYSRRFTDADVVLTGDFNICWDERDLASPSLISDAELHPSRPEDLAFRRLVEDAGLVDCVRERITESGHYTWFPVTSWSLRRNYGMRLDYVFATQGLADRLQTASHLPEPRTWSRPSDHLPVLAHFAGELDPP